MQTGKKNNTPSKKNTKGKTETGPKKEAGTENQKIIKCHLTDMQLRACPTINCMWSDKKGGCLYRRGVEAEDYGLDLGIPDADIPTAIRKGKSEITRFIVLDSYIQFLKENLIVRGTTRLAGLIRADDKIAEILRTSKTYPILQSHFSLDNFIVSQMCDETLYSEFSQRLGIKPPNVVTLTGIRELYQGRLRDRIAELKKTLRGKHKSKRRKKRHKGKENERSNQTCSKVT